MNKHRISINNITEIDSKEFILNSIFDNNFQLKQLIQKFCGHLILIKNRKHRRILVKIILMNKASNFKWKT